MNKYCLSLAAAFLSGITAAATPPIAPTPPAPSTATAPATLGFTGILTVGVIAIGGETTGTIIRDGKTTYELDIRDAVLQRKAQELNGKSVTVKGTLTVKPGVEITTRYILLVDSLQPADAAPPATTPAPPVPTPPK